MRNLDFSAKARETTGPEKKKEKKLRHKAQRSTKAWASPKLDFLVTSGMDNTSEFIPAQDGGV